MAVFPGIVSCECGAVKCHALSAPIVTAVCYCKDCQAAAGKMQERENIKSFEDPDGGTPYVTFRDRHFSVMQGEDQLLALKLTPEAPTTRYITRCCNSPMFLKHKNGFWTSTYRTRFDDPPPIEWRNKVAARQSELPYTDDAPRYDGFPLRLFVRLIKARFS